MRTCYLLGVDSVKAALSALGQLSFVHIKDQAVSTPTHIEVHLWQAPRGVIVAIVGGFTGGERGEVKALGKYVVEDVWEDRAEVAKLVRQALGGDIDDIVFLATPQANAPSTAITPQAKQPVAPTPSIQLPAPAAPTEHDIHQAPTSISHPMPESIYHTPTLITNQAPETIRTTPATAPMAGAEGTAPPQIESGEQTRDTSKQSAPTPRDVPGVHFPKPDTDGPRRRLLKGWKRRTALALLVVLLLAGGTLGYLAIFGVTVSATYTFTTVPGVTTMSRQHVNGRLLSMTAFDAWKQQTAPATGGPAPAAQARGTLNFYNNTSQSVFLPHGSVLHDKDAGCTAPIQMVLDADVTIPASPDGQWQGVAVPAHVLQYGTIGNIPAFGDQGCFHSDEGQAGADGISFSGWVVQNETPFTGGRDAILQQSDIDRAAHSLMVSIPVPDPRQELAVVIASKERLLDTPAPACQPKVTADHAVGETVGEALVTFFYTCTGYVYDHDGAVQLATMLLADRYGSFFKPKGQITSTVTSAVVIDPQQGTIRLTVVAEGTLVFQW